jgi:hypothetical protein
MRTPQLPLCGGGGEFSAKGGDAGVRFVLFHPCHVRAADSSRMWHHPPPSYLLSVNTINVTTMTTITIRKKTP